MTPSSQKMPKSPRQSAAGSLLAFVDADEGAPGGRKSGADQHVARAVAEHAAIAADVGPEGADLVLARGIEQPGQDNQNTGDHIHRRSPCHPPDEAASTMAAGPFILPHGCCDLPQYFCRIFHKFFSSGQGAVPPRGTPIIPPPRPRAV